MKKNYILKWIAAFLGMVMVMLVTFFEIASYCDFRDEMCVAEKIFGLVMTIICLPTVVWLWNKTEKYEDKIKAIRK